MAYFNYYNYFDYFFDSEKLAVTITDILGIIVFAAVIGLILWVFGAIGIFKMSQKLRLKYPWLSFILPIYPFAIGRVAQKYVKKNGESSAKFGFWLIALYILNTVLLIAFAISFFFALYNIGVNAFNTIEIDDIMTAEMFRPAIPAIVLYFISLAVGITYKVVYYVAFWRICAIFDRDSATLFLVLSIVLSKLLLPIFLFAIRNKEPQAACLAEESPVQITFPE